MRYIDDDSSPSRIHILSSETFGLPSSSYPSLPPDLLLYLLPPPSSNPNHPAVIAALHPEILGSFKNDELQFDKFETFRFVRCSEQNKPTKLFMIFTPFLLYGQPCFSTVTIYHHHCHSLLHLPSALSNSSSFSMFRTLHQAPPPDYVVGLHSSFAGPFQESQGSLNVRLWWVCGRLCPIVLTQLSSRIVAGTLFCQNGRVRE
jgi:hypothetical protein